MKTKKVSRYYCDFCTKSNCSAPSMSKHEKRCTMNPKRECGMCKFMENEQPDLTALIALLPDPSDYKREFDESGCTGWSDYDFGDLFKTVLPKLREATRNCPACMMAALRQRGIPILSVDGFNFTAECKRSWAEFNEAQAQKHYAY